MADRTHRRVRPVRGFTRMDGNIGGIDLLGKAMWVTFALIVITGIGFWRIFADNHAVIYLG